MKEALRERTHSWSDPREVLRIIAGREHLEWMRDSIEGRVSAPAAMRTLGIELVSAEPGRVRFTMEAHEWMLNPLAVVHGGITATLLDSALTLALLSTLPVQKVCSTLNLNVHFVRPILATGETVTGEATVVHCGSTVGTTEGRVTDARGRVVAHGSATLAIRDATRFQA